MAFILQIVSTFVLFFRALIRKIFFLGGSQIVNYLVVGDDRGNIVLMSAVACQW
jgi:hypothetical protein